MGPSKSVGFRTQTPDMAVSFSASSLYPGVNPRRVRPMMNIFSYEVSTERGQRQGRVGSARGDGGRDRVGVPQLWGVLRLGQL